MNEVFLDTSGLIAVVNTRDQWHGPAEKVWGEIINGNSLLVTTSLVLAEIGDGLAKVRHRALACSLIESLLHSPRIVVVHITPELFKRAWLLYCGRTDKEWGVTDCSSFVVMQARSIEDVFSSDHHFAQAGFVPLIG